MRWWWVEGLNIFFMPGIIIEKNCYKFTMYEKESHYRRPFFNKYAAESLASWPPVTNATYIQKYIHVTFTFIISGPGKLYQYLQE